MSQPINKRQHELFKFICTFADKNCELDGTKEKVTISFETLCENKIYEDEPTAFEQINEDLKVLSQCFRLALNLGEFYSYRYGIHSYNIYSDKVVLYVNLDVIITIGEINLDS